MEFIRNIPNKQEWRKEISEEAALTGGLYIHPNIRLAPLQASIDPIEESDNDYALITCRGVIVNGDRDVMVKAVVDRMNAYFDMMELETEITVETPEGANDDDRTKSTDSD